MDENIRTKMLWLIGGLLIALIAFFLLVVNGGWNLMIELIFKKLNIAINVL